MFFDYLKERQNIDSLVSDIGFATYEIVPQPVPHIIVYDFYIRKEARLSGAGKKIVLQLETLAKSAGCKFCMTQIDKNSRGWEAALEFQKKCGMRTEKETDDTVYLRRDL